jgi:DNA repair protein RecO (recombination protein O)
LNFLPARGFVLKANPLGEADKIVHLFTLQLGRVKAVAKGIRKPKSKMVSSVDLFTESSFSLHKKAAGGLYVLGQAKVLNAHSDLKKDFNTITALQVLAEILGETLPEAEPHPEIYSLLKEVLGELRDHPQNQELFLTAFAIKFIDQMGYPLELNLCAECGSPLQRKQVFLIPNRGGVLCESCCSSGPSRLKMTPAGLEVMKKFKSLPLKKIHILKLKPVFIRQLFLAILEYLEQTIETKLKTPEYYLKVLPIHA